MLPSLRWARGLPLTCRTQHFFCVWRLAMSHVVVLKSVCRSSLLSRFMEFTASQKVQSFSSSEIFFWMTSVCPSLNYGLRVYAFLQCTSSRVDGFLERSGCHPIQPPCVRFSSLGITHLVFKYATTTACRVAGPFHSPFRGVCFAAHRNFRV